MQDWRQVLASSFRDIPSLLDYLKIHDRVSDLQRLAEKDFPILVPKPFADLMESGNPNDPLLLQVLPRDNETETVAGYIADPLTENQTNIQKGIIHKYQGRLLLLAATSCAVNCRYCFRRHFDYSKNRIGRSEWNEALDYVRSAPSITEVILSGGDPFMLQDKQLFELFAQVESIPHVERLRIHTRLPVVIPQRLTSDLINRLNDSRLASSMVLHINHPNELSDELAPKLRALRSGGTWLFNQAVLLKNINDKLDTLESLSHELFKFNILPYYLHLLDPVTGAHHFDVPKQDAIELYQQLQAKVPGYLLPRLVREVPNTAYKTLINVD